MLRRWIPKVLGLLSWGWSSAMAAQSITPELLTVLPLAQQEVSGIIHVDGMTWVCLDSNNPNKLYRIDTVTGAVLRELELSNATNIDWEDVAADEEWVYVADIGNNTGARTDLRFYRFQRAALWGPADVVLVDTIRFYYADQTDHTPIPDGTNWDAEAVLAYDDSLYIFTKNWTDERTHRYALPARPGEQVALRRSEFDTQGLITGATRDPDQGTIVLLGHSRLSMEPFIWILRPSPDQGPFGGATSRHVLTVSPMQAEAIAHTQHGQVIIGNERIPSLDQALWSLTLPLGISNPGPSARAISIFPVPADRYMHVQGADTGQQVRILELNGTMLESVVIQADGRLDLPYLPPGEYFLDLTVRRVRCLVPLIIAR